MFYVHLRRGGIAGLAGGLAFGAFTAFVVNPLVAVAEHFEAGHAAAEGAGYAHVLATATAKATSVGFGALWGVLLGVAVFGVAYFFTEPALPGGEGTRSYVLGAAGFLSLSVAPWLVLPPRPPGVEAALSTDARTALYAGMVLAGALACVLAVLAANRLDGPARPIGIAAPFLALGALAVLAPANPTSGAAPASLVAAFRAVVVAGQLGLWGVMAAVHATLTKRAALRKSDVVDADDLSPA